MCGGHTARITNECWLRIPALNVMIYGKIRWPLSYILSENREVTCCCNLIWSNKIQDETSKYNSATAISGKVTPINVGATISEIESSQKGGQQQGWKTGCAWGTHMTHDEPRRPMHWPNSLTTTLQPNSCGIHKPSRMDAPGSKDDERRLTFHAWLWNSPDPPLWWHEYGVRDHGELPYERRRPTAQWKAEPLAHISKTSNSREPLSPSSFSLSEPQIATDAFAPTK